ncbi:hypothetical protein SAMN04488587_1637 [Methanococcoides vulcani]|uniref:Uncharacterized protein n=1 Tax=Methanococcoides vulcani TaxID=1353158 RepID=A0A1I0AFW1_9EURY|nr:hypothetical protein SAMN04488587_1637 [Methanococcoides vulcani]
MYCHRYDDWSIHRELALIGGCLRWNMQRRVRYAQTLSISDYLSIEIYDYEEELLVFSIAVA